MLHSLYSKFFLFTIMTMIISAIISFFAVNTYYHQLLKSENDAKNTNIINVMTNYIETNPDIDLDDFLTLQADVGYKLLLVKKDEGENVSQMFGVPFRKLNLQQPAIDKVLNGANYHGMRDLPKETFVTGFFSDEAANTVGTSFHYNGDTYALFLRPNIKLLFTEVHHLLGGLFIGMALISLVAMLFGAYYLIKPLQQLTAATEIIGAGQYNVPLPVKRNDEIGQLALSFSHMTTQLKKADMMQKQFITDVSHDLQTPLQQIKGYASLIKEDNISETSKQEYLHIIESEANRLSRLSRQLLLLTSLDRHIEQIEWTTFRVDEQLKQIVQRFRWQLEKHNLSVTANLQQITFVGIEPYIEQLWENLLTNAIKYTYDGTTIYLSLTKGEHVVEVIVRDEGIGIPKEHIPYIFDRFYRIDESRHAAIEGTGLGLAIVKRIADLHDGTIYVHSNINQGTTITVRLPINKTDEHL